MLNHILHIHLMLTSTVKVTLDMASTHDKMAACPLVLPALEPWLDPLLSGISWAFLVILIPETEEFFVQYCSVQVSTNGKIILLTSDR